MLNKFKLVVALCSSFTIFFGQNTLTPELMWTLHRVSPMGISKDRKWIVYKVSTPSIEDNKMNSKTYRIPLSGGTPELLSEVKELMNDRMVSPDGKYTMYSEEVKVEPVWGNDFYPELSKSNVQMYNSLNYRHWDTWNEGKYNHVFYKLNEANSKGVDIMTNSPFDCPQKPSGGDEDMVWSPDSKKILYVTKQNAGTAYALSTNSDVLEYSIETKKTANLTENNKGYDTYPTFGPDGTFSWLQMKRDGYEADKNDLITRINGVDINQTAQWDGTVESFMWDASGRFIIFRAPVGGTQQLFKLIPAKTVNTKSSITQVTNGDFDINDLVGIEGDILYVNRGSFHRANELYSYHMKTNKWTQLTHVNDEIYSSLSPSTSEKRFVTTKDGKKMLVWVVYPPNFDKNKKYPTLLYCQGGPQSALTQFHSYRWNLGLIASQGYIVVAPNRRGMPGHGVQWNEEISKDWGGKPMDDYLAAIDDVSKESYVDVNRRGAIGASYGGYSVFFLAGIHQNRFKTFISHCGIFDLESMYGSTEEVFFSNWDMGGAYWEKNNAAAQKIYNDANPIKLVNNWNTPILIFQGAKDYRVPMGQAQEAFQAAQLKGIKSRFILFNDENHWISKPQNSLVWQREFFKWLRETL
jgi:dipeptidyl aminopeptidase/acylaminoacyl peptidase